MGGNSVIGTTARAAVTVAGHACLVGPTSVKPDGSVVLSGPTIGMAVWRPRSPGAGAVVVVTSRAAGLVGDLVVHAEVPLLPTTCPAPRRAVQRVGTSTAERQVLVEVADGALALLAVDVDGGNQDRRPRRSPEAVEVAQALPWRRGWRRHVALTVKASCS